METKVAPNYSFVPAASAFENTANKFSPKFLEDVRSIEAIINNYILRFCEEGSTHCIMMLDRLTDATTNYILLDKAKKEKALEIIHDDLLAAGYRVSAVPNGTIEFDWKDIRNVAEQF